jgi:hypothetical protein
MSYWRSEEGRLNQAIREGLREAGVKGPLADLVGPILRAVLGIEPTGVNLAEGEIRRLLRWANGCDGESYIGEDDWPLIEKLAGKIGVDPTDAAPYYASEREAQRDP